MRRATATRPDAVLDPAAVRAVVERLDGLPLAVELAAARVRTMTVAEVATALDDRFATLRSRDRTTPDRHRTLEAVIAWSWDLLAAEEQRALAWLSVFQDGVARATAAAVLGPDGPDLVDGLVEQSLLVVTEDGGAARFRALETIREYAAAQLARTGEHEAALAAQRRWAADLADRSTDLVVDDDQVRVVDVLVREQNNLTDVLRHALAVGDRDLAARLVGLLGSLWTITGDQPRIFAICDAASELLDGLGRARRAPPTRARGGGGADGPPQLDARRRPRRPAGPAPAGRATVRHLRADRTHGARRRRAGRHPRPARPGGRRTDPTRHGRGAPALGGDRRRERRRRGGGRSVRRVGAGRRLAAAVPPRLAPRRAEPAGHGSRRPPPGRAPCRDRVAAPAAGALADRRLQPAGRHGHRPAAGRRHRHGTRAPGGVRAPGRRERPDECAAGLADRARRGGPGPGRPPGGTAPLRRDRRHGAGG